MKAGSPTRWATESNVAAADLPVDPQMHDFSRKIGRKGRDICSIELEFAYFIG
jgi:hypothetical protein